MDDEDSTRYADIVAFKNSDSRAYIIDPTIRYESNDPRQAEKVHEEKRALYGKCFGFHSEKFSKRNFKVYGLWFGA